MKNKNSFAAGRYPEAWTLTDEWNKEWANDR